jgi:hypothetical protein
MTESELELLRLKLKIEAIVVLVRALYIGLANSSPTVTQAFRVNFSSLRESHSQVAIPGIPPEFSDLVAGEYQEALDDFLKLIESGFRF